MKSRWEETYPNLKVSLDEDCEPAIEAIIAECRAGLGHIFNTLDDERENALLDGLVEALKAYLTGILERSDQRSESEDNAALERVSNSAKELYDALIDLLDHPGIEPRLERQIREFPNLYTLKAGVCLSDLIEGRSNIFFGFREALVDLQVCAENEINRKPKEVLIDGIDDNEKPFRTDSDEELSERLREWRQRSKARRYEKDHALLCFLQVLRPHWEQSTAFPFTEGMHFREIGDTQSPLVDLTEHVLVQLDGDITRPKIVNAIRKLRRQNQEHTPS